jgi:hypothetical protein
VTDYARVSARQLETSQRIAGRVYAKIGVPIMWVDGNAAEMGRDGAVHLDMAILGAAMTARGDAPPDALGKAGRESKRASVYYGRVVEHATRTHADLDQVLALALAHELGHLLLPDYSHTKRGLMQAARTGRIVAVPDLLPAQAATIRIMLIVEAARVRSSLQTHHESLSSCVATSDLASLCSLPALFAAR